VEVRRRRGELDAELAHARDVIEVTADDLARGHRGQMSGALGVDASAVGRDELRPVDDDVGHVAVEQYPAILHAVPQSRLNLNDKCHSTDARRGGNRACYVRYVVEGDT
jgi:hypothetical protein